MAKLLICRSCGGLDHERDEKVWPCISCEELITWAVDQEKRRWFRQELNVLKKRTLK